MILINHHTPFQMTLFKERQVVLAMTVNLDVMCFQRKSRLFGTSIRLSILSVIAKMDSAQEGYVTKKFNRKTH